MYFVRHTTTTRSNQNHINDGGGPRAKCKVANIYTPIGLLISTLVDIRTWSKL